MNAGPVHDLHVILQDWQTYETSKYFWLFRSHTEQDLFGNIYVPEGQVKHEVKVPPLQVWHELSHGRHLLEESR